MSRDDASPPPRRAKPFDPDAERAILGHCLGASVDEVDRIRAHLGDGDANPFLDTENKHADIWDCICAIRNEGGAPTFFAVRAKMAERHPQWNSVYLIEAGEWALRYDEIALQEVRNYFIAREVVQAGMRIEDAGRRVDPDHIHGVVEGIVERLHTISAGTNGRRAPWHDSLTAGDYLLSNDTPTGEAIWGDDERVLWMAGEALLLVGPPGVGKSTLAGQLVAARMGFFGEILKLPVSPTGKRILYIAADRPAQIIRALQRLLPHMHHDAAYKNADLAELLRDRLVLWRGPIPRMTTDDSNILRDMAIDADADTVVVDSLKDVAVDLSKDGPSSMYNIARQKALAAGIDLLELHHLTKHGPEGRQPTTLQDVYGGMHLTAGAGSVVLLWGKAGDLSIKLYHLKQPMEVVGPMWVRHDHTTGTSDIGATPDPLEYVRSPRGMTAREFADHYYTQVEGRNAKDDEVEQWTRRLDRLVVRALLIRHPHDPLRYFPGGTL